MPATVPALVAGVQALPAEVTSWSATGIGRGHLPIMAAALPPSPFMIMVSRIGACNC
jgi:uncharacterized protein (DUF849 family)